MRATVTLTRKVACFMQADHNHVVMNKKNSTILMSSC
jgi:hypothetical protein